MLSSRVITGAENVSLRRTERDSNFLILMEHFTPLRAYIATQQMTFCDETETTFIARTLLRRVGYGTMCCFQLELRQNQANILIFLTVLTVRHK